MNSSSASGWPECRLLVDTCRAAEVLCISRRTLWSETKAGRLPVVRIGRAVRYDIRDLLAYIEARKSGGQQ